MVTVIRVMISWVVSVILPDSNLKQLRDALAGASGRFAKRKSVKFGPKSSFDVVDDAEATLKRRFTGGEKSLDDEKKRQMS